MQSQLYEIAYDAHLDCLQRDVYVCARALLHGADPFDVVPAMPEFERVCSFLTEKGRMDLPYSVQAGALDGSCAAWLELSVCPLSGWNRLWPWSRMTIVVRHRRCARISDGMHVGWASIG